MKTLFSIIFLVISSSLFAQDFEVPNYKFKKKQDFAKYNKAIIECIDYLISTPLNEQSGKRQEASKFFVEWVMGTPDVTIEVDFKKVEFLNEEPQFLISYMAGWSKYVLKTKDKIPLNGMIAGIESTITFYLNNRDTLAESQTIEKYMQLKQDDKLKEYIEEKAG
jgi:hypothetical protein